MHDKLINRRDLAFILYQLLDAERLTERPRYADHSRETFDAALDVAHRIAAEHFATHNRKADLNEPTFDGQRVQVIPEVKRALDVFCRAGLIAAQKDYEHGGMQLPATIAQAGLAMFNAANVSTAAYPFITIANANLIEAFGSDDQKARYLPHLLSGRFFGTMCLSEPQAGSSLSDIRTRAEPQADGSYRIIGNKMWISGGEHELSENIVHLVLAKIPGGPPGVKGISLFIVPKFLVHADGSPGRRNDIAVAGLNHKMGYRGTTNCVLNFGEHGGAVGELVGEPHKGLSYMFQMMNEARIGIGLGATMLGYSGYLHSLAYARERLQGRPPAGKDATQPQIRLIEHADIRRMLLAQKAYVEGGLALCLYAARLFDDQQTGPSEQIRREAHLLLEILTPIVKSWPSQWCLEANSLAIQVLGGYGYTREYPLEQLYRDNRLNPIHEGTHGIQALDLLGRKAGMQDGAALQLLLRELHLTVREAGRCDSPQLRRYGEALAASMHQLIETTRNLLCAAGNGELELSLANASLYLEASGHVVVAALWLRQALVAVAALRQADGGDRDFYQGKLQACAFFFGWELPKTKHQLELLNNLDRTCYEMQDSWY
ncbi:MAG TPA: acyl-CoA dehydrogenase [Burkholderiales bacterium]|nr:acyl-CoA dehydrogenase [Burkholderiales bacterium]